MKEFIGFNIGCNIVDPDCDDGANYNEDVYIRNIAKYYEYGFRHIEFSHVLALDKAAAGRIREFCRNIGMIPWSIHSEHLNGSGEVAYLETQTHCATICKALDAKVMVCHIPNIEPRAGDLQRDIKVITKVADITRRFGLKLAIETPPYDYIIEIVDMIGRDDVGINLDSGHTFLEGHDPAAVARKIGKRLFTTHLQDNFGINDDHQPPGLGKIDWASLLTALKEIKYTGPLLMEMTGAGVKIKRSVVELRDFSLEKELIFARAYLEYLSATG
ncbi:MAG: sugar phosphate isomerase/epimerase [Victivallaceae bacterium]|nr:sugar phosphate isomerase/epimerase [Victivallaceae bacterium]